MKNRYNTIVIGSGCAGYHAAERLYMLGVRDIAIITEGRSMGTSRNTGSDKQTYYKLSLCGAEGDSVREMAETLYSGGGVDGDIALTEAAYSTRCFMHLVELGVPFPTNEYGEYAGYKTDHDPRSRATSCGPLTSKYMTEALERSVNEKNIEIIDFHRVIKLITEDGIIRGLAAINTKSLEISVISCQNIILCTGGPAGIYENTVYPESQNGGTGLAIDAGADMVNLEEWQYGIASTKFRWNLSGSYQQVLPRYISVDKDGIEHEFLYDALGERSLDMIFLKGYQWPFDTRKADASSQVDLLVAREIKSGRRVFLDYKTNPRGLENGFDSLLGEAYDYLARSGALLESPISRLEALNKKAIELYASHGIDLYSERLEIAVCAQHSNGGVRVDSNWQTGIRGLYAAGEVAGTFGVYRPGGSALNSTQVGGLRAAEHISSLRCEGDIPEARYSLTCIRYGESNIQQIRKDLRRKMSCYADFERDIPEMEKLLGEVSELCENFTERVFISSKADLPDFFLLQDTALTQRAVLSAMLCSAREIGSHGSACIKGEKIPAKQNIRSTKTITTRERSEIVPVKPIPDAELWFEALLSRQNNK
ncbi:MAG: FAD-binding protein [Clostridia bacterium]|nr:FAD-binding protein [Clostridia bacterium]